MDELIDHHNVMAVELVYDGRIKDRNYVLMLLVPQPMIESMDHR